MDWLKKNLVLVISGVISLAIIGAAGYYLLSKIQDDATVEEELSTARTTYTGLIERKPFPNQENVAAAKEQLDRINQYLTNATRYIGAPITPKDYPSTLFLGMLEETAAGLRNAAQAAKTTIPTNYYFSFAAQKEKGQFATNTMTYVVAQIEDVKAICGVIFNAHVYELLAIQRAPVTADDTNAMTTHASSYLSTKRTSTTEYTTVYPYVVSVRCAAQELADTLEGFARARYGFFVKWVRVEPGEVSAEGEDASGMGSPRSDLARRYGMRSRYAPPAEAATPEAFLAAQAAAKKVGVILKEKPLKVTIMLEVIRGLAPDSKS